MSYPKKQNCLQKQSYVHAISFPNYLTKHIKSYLILFLLMIFTMHGYGQTIRYVDRIASGLGDGSSWANKSNNLQAMIDASSPGDSVFVTIMEIFPPSATTRFHLKNGVSVYGGFVGTETNSFQRKSNVAASKFRTGWNTSINDYDRVPIFINNNLDSTTVLDGFMFNFTFGGDTTAACLQNYNSSPTIKNCKFLYASAKSDGVHPNGGAIRNFYSNPKFINCVFYDDKGQRATGDLIGTSYVGGEVMYNLYSKPTLFNCSFLNNNISVWDPVNNTNILLAGIVIYNDQGSKIKAVNSIFYDHPVVAVKDLGTERSEITYSIAYDTIGGGPTNIEHATTYPFTEDATTNINHDLSILWNSQAREGGDPLTNTAGYPVQIGDHDLKYNSRTKGARVDIGAYELDGATYPFITNFSNFSKTYGDADFDLGATSISPAPITYTSGNANIVSISGSIATILKVGTVTITASQEATAGFPATSKTITLTIARASLSILGVNSSKVVGQTEPTLYYKVGANGFKYNDNAGVMSGTLTRTAGETVGTYTINVGSLSAGNNYTINFTTANFYIGVSKYVKPTATGLGNATSWTDASGDLQGTIALANNGDQVWVAAGTYTSSATSKAFTLKDKVGVYGGFVGNETSLEQRNWNTNTTTLTTNQAVTGNALIDNGSVTLSSVTRLDGFTITNTYGGVMAGGMYNNNSSPTIANCIFSNNSAGTGASTTRVAAMYNDNGASPRILNSKFINNNSGLVVGAIYDTLNASPTITNVTFSNNSAALAAGVYNANGSVATITNSIFWGDAVLQIMNGTNIGTATATVTYSDVQQGSGTYTGTGNLNINPSFNNTNFGLLSTSAVIDAGDPITNNTAYINAAQSESFDLNAGTRIVSDQIDMGAYEFAPSTNTVITANAIIKTYGDADFSAGVSSTSPATLTYTSSDPSIATVNASGIIHIVKAGTITLTIRQRASGDYRVASTTSTITINKATLSINPDKKYKLVGQADPTYSYTFGTNGLVNNDLASVVTGTLTRTAGEAAGAYSFGIGTLDAGNNYIISLGNAKLYIGSIKYVKQELAGRYDATSWSNASNDLALVLETAIEGDQIWVAKGTYTQYLNRAFLMNYNIKVYGGFDGTETDLSQRNWKLNPTIMKGNGKTVLKISNVDNNAVLDGFTLKDGTSMGSEGGGIHLFNASPIINNCIIRNNSVVFDENANQSGGITVTYNSNPIITNTVFAKNKILPSTTNGGVTTYASGFHGANAIVNSNMDPSNNNVGASQLVKIYNCTFYGTNTIGSNAINDAIYTLNGAFTKMSNSIMYNQSIAKDNSSNVNVSYSDILGSYVGIGGHIINVEPKFVDTTNDDYRLLSSSPLIDAGDPTTNVNANSAQVGDLDLGFRSRIYSSAIDLGAYELLGINTSLSHLADSTKTYGAAAFLLTAQTTAPTPIIYQSADTTIAKIIGVNGDMVNIVGTGTVTITATLAPNGDYFPATLSMLLTVNKANLTIQANAISKRKNQVDPMLTYTFGADGNGLVNNDPSSVISGTLTRTSGINVGTYSITLGTISANNYIIHFTGNTFTIRPSGEIRYVKQDATGDGTSWANASGSIQSMINLSNESDSIFVANGSFDAINRIEMKNGIHLFGGFKGTELAVHQRDLKNKATYLNGTNNSLSIVLFQNIDSLTFLDGFILQGANCIQYGGAIKIDQSNVFIKNCVFTNNRSKYGAGVAILGTANINAIVKIQNCVFNANRSSGGGASGIYNNEFGQLSVKNTSFYNNIANDSIGSAIVDFSHFGTPIINSTFYNNKNVAGPAKLYLSYESQVANSILFDKLPNASNYNNIRFSIVQHGVAGTGNLDNTSILPSAIFVDTLNDLSLKANSIAIDAGDASTNALQYQVQADSLDILNNNRIVWGRVDLGAYEFQTLKYPRIDLMDITKTYGDQDFIIPINSNSSAPITFTSSDTTIASVYQNSNNNNWYVKIKEYGKVHLTANQSAIYSFSMGEKTDTLTINPFIVASIKDTAQCGNLVWNGIIYSSSGTYSQSFKHIRTGVDSVATARFTYKPYPAVPTITNKIKNVFSSTPAFQSSTGNDYIAFTNDSLNLVYSYTHQLCSNATDTIYLQSSEQYKNKWYLDGSQLMNDTLSQLKVRRPGVYKLVVDWDGCTATADQDSIYISDVTKSGLPSKDSLICKGSFIEPEAMAYWDGFKLNDLTAQSNLAKFRWTSQSGNFTDTISKPKLSLPDTYYVKIFSRGCLINDTIRIRNTIDTAVKARMVVTEQAFVNQPIKALNITNMPAQKFEWILPSTPSIPRLIETTDTAITFRLTEIGSYKIGLRCISHDVCISEDFSKLVISLNDSSLTTSSQIVTIRDVLVGPNPSITGIFNIKVSLNTQGPLTIRVVQLTGRSVLNKLVPASDKIVQERLDLSDLTPGTYVLILQTSNGHEIRTLLNKM